jgi:predicted nucleotidyltransferase
MPSVVELLEKKGLIHPPSWLADNIHYEVLMGSVAYGVSSDTSDMDIYGWGIPPKHIVFPHLDGDIQGFGREKDRFEQFQQHHVFFEDALAGKGRTYDLSIYNIVKYFQLCMDNNPNMVDSLFVPVECVLHSTQIGNMVRENKKLFLHKGCFQKFKGYAFSQLSKASNVSKDKSIVVIRAIEEKYNIPHSTTLKEVEKEADNRRMMNEEGDQPTLPLNPIFEKVPYSEMLHYARLYREGMQQTKRFESQKIHNTDVKFLYHIVRLVDECEQILTLGDLDLRRAREHMKAIRRGEISEQEVKEWFNLKEKQLEELYNREPSPVPYSPPVDKIKKLLLTCLEHHYGSLDKCIVEQDAHAVAVQEVIEVLRKHKLC